MPKVNRGFIKLVIIIVVAIFLLNYFHIDLRGLIERYRLGNLIEQIMRAFRALWSIILNLWQKSAVN